MNHQDQKLRREILREVLKYFDDFPPPNDSKLCRREYTLK